MAQVNISESLSEKSDYITGIEDEAVRQNKLSMLSAPNKVAAFVPDFENEEELRSFGLVREDDGWHVPNREWFPNALTEDSIVIDYGQRADGSRDIGFCSKEEFSTIYADTSKYEDGQIDYIDATQLGKGLSEIVSVTKCATGEFVIVPAGTVVMTQEGEVTVAPGHVLIVNERKNSVFVTDIEEILNRYVADPLNPASQDAFMMMQGYLESEQLLLAEDDDARKGLHAQLTDLFIQLDRGRKVYEEYTSELLVTDLESDYKKAREIVKGLSEKYANKLNSLSFEENLSVATELIEAIFRDKSLDQEQKDAEISYILVSLLPKSNNHQHLKGSIPMDVLLGLAEKHGFNQEQIEDIKKAYQEGEAGFDNLDSFNSAYGIIGNAVRTPEDYRVAVRGIIFEAVRAGQLTTEIRCSAIGQRDENGQILEPQQAIENLLTAMRLACEELRNEGIEPPKVGLTLLGYRGRDWHPEEVIQHAQLAVEFATKYPNRKFSFDIAGPEDTGYSPYYFKEAYDTLHTYNAKIESGELVGEKIGITTHAGETPTFDNDPTKSGSGSVIEALDMGVDRIGHGVQAITDPEALKRLEESGATVEICGVCNVLSIPINTRGLTVHPVQELIARGIPVTICTDNDSICGTKITEEYAQFLFTGHSELMNWNNVKQIARNGITSAFITESDKSAALSEFESRVRRIEKALNDVRDGLRRLGSVAVLEPA